jgi:glutathione synthase/RimK-type ligase-like ATP-grasp enzyme
MILICGALADPVTKIVCARLEHAGYPYRLLDLSVYPAGFQVNWQWRKAGPTGYISNTNWRLDLEDISSVYVRYIGSQERNPPSNITKEFLPALYTECDTCLSALLESLPCPVVNRMRGSISNNSKPYQALQIRRCGFRIPPTLVTNDPEAARRFYEEYSGKVIYKSISGVRSIVRRMNAEHLVRLPLLQHAPAQLQAYIPGDNIRVHTVGHLCFGTRIKSAAIDYRYAREEGLAAEMEPSALPDEVAAACLRVARQFQLLFAGIDLKETPEGDYYCFEVNPSPGFFVYEQQSGQCISRALAQLLRDGATGQLTAGQNFTDA